MVLLSRTVRFCINDPGPVDGRDSASSNTFAGAPSMSGLGRYYELVVRCRGEVNPATGYFVNIKAIDQAVRAAAVPIIARACVEDPSQSPSTVLANVLPALSHALGQEVQSVRWKLTPYYGIEMSPREAKTVLIRQQFDFAAAHRLHSPALSDDDNRRVFGKCNNPSGHGHNYRVEPCVAIDLSQFERAHSPASPFGLAELERVTTTAVIDRFDHTHLNQDTPEFASLSGLNPSVENIARVSFELLAPAIRAASQAATLRSITVWETDKTSCTYPAD